MKISDILQAFVQAGAVSEEQANLIAQQQKTRPLSIHDELRLLLYGGIVLTTSAVGVLIYREIDRIGHLAVIISLGLGTAGLFLYAFKNRKPFSWSSAGQNTSLPDYALLLACCLFLVLEGYLMSQYNFLENRYGIAALIPAVLFFPLAYIFDHRGVLSMAITALASWAGLSAAPLSVFSRNDFHDQHLVNTAIALGAALVAAGLWSEKQNRKSHFAFTYLLFGLNLAVIASMVAMMADQWPVLYALVATAVSVLMVMYARQSRSYIFLLLGTVYAYIIITYWLFHATPNAEVLIIYYFMLSSGGVIVFLLNVKKILGLKDEKSL